MTVYGFFSLGRQRCFTLFADVGYLPLLYGYEAFLYDGLFFVHRDDGAIMNQNVDLAQAGHLIKKAIVSSVCLYKP